MNVEVIRRVQVGDDAQMAVPVDLEWHLRYGDPVKVRFMAAEVVAGLHYLIHECTKEEAWRRLKLMRAATRGRHVL